MGSCISSHQQNSFFADSRQLWQDRQIRWDQPRPAILMRSGEVIVHQWGNIEDTKGENGLGDLILSNLRIVWTAGDNLKLNISIGLGNVAYVHYNMVDSLTFGRVRASHLMTQSGSSRFEFTFATRSEASLGMFTELDNALRRYRATRVFRELILREEQLMQPLGDEVVTYYGEHLLRSRVECENLTSEEKFPGMLFVTDKRLIWNASHQTLVNVSIPFIQIQHIGTRSSNFGLALVIETCTSAGGYVLGFRFTTPKLLADIRELLEKLHAELRMHPYFGPLDGTVHYVDDRLVVLDYSSERPAFAPSSSPSLETTREVSLVPIDAPFFPDTTVKPDHNAAEKTKSPMSSAPTASGSADPDDSKHLKQNPVSDLSGDVTELPSLLEKSKSCGLTLPLPTYEGQPVSSASHTTPSLRSSQERNVAFLDTNNLPWNILDITARKRVMESLLRRSVMSPTSKEPLDLHRMSPLPIGVRNGQASVTFSSSSRAAINRTDLLLAMSPSSKKYRAPKCVVCMATMTEVAFDPCGHLCSCMKCAIKMKHCPICRGGVDKVLRIYLQAA